MYIRAHSYTIQYNTPIHTPPHACRLNANETLSFFMENSMKGRTKENSPNNTHIPAKIISTRDNNVISYSDFFNYIMYTHIHVFLIDHTE